MEWLILLAVLGAGAVGYAGFAIGDRRRRREGGSAGPRPLRSIGEALSLAEARLGRTLVIFLGEDDESVAVAEAFANNPRVVGLLDDAKLGYVVLRSDREGEDVQRLLFEKYQGEPLPGLPAGLLLGTDGKPVHSGVIQGDVGLLMDRWLRQA